MLFDRDTANEGVPEFEIVSAEFGDGAQNAHRFGRDFGTDSISSDYQYLELHRCLPASVAACAPEKFSSVSRRFRR